MSYKYKVFGYIVVAFIIFMLWLFLKPKEGLNAVLFDADNIDSILIYRADKKIVLDSLYDIASISKEVKMCKRVFPDRVNINTGFVDLLFFVKNQKESYTVRIMYNYYNGILINANDLYYKNDNLNKIVIRYLQE